MAIAAGIDAPQGQILSVDRQTAADERTTQFLALAPYNVPSMNMRSGQAAFITSIRALAPIETTQLESLAVVRGRVQTPQIRVFTITLAGHDFYVIRLGDYTTLVYDVYSQQWVEWTSNSLPFWRANVGCNWIGAQKLAAQYGSDIVIGDDTIGLLYFLDPNQPFDDHTDYLNAVQQVDFERIIMAQITASGRTAMPCYVIFLDTDNYGLTANDFTPFVRLDYSDDQGQTFVSADTLTAQPNTNDLDYRWYSLGQVTTPGRLFRVTDNGLLARIDAMQMNDE